MRGWGSGEGRERWSKIILAVTLLLWPLAANAPAQVGIVSPTPGQRLATGAEYATDVLGDPWDMSNREDYSLWEGDNAGLANLGVDGTGLFTGTFTTDDASVGLLHRGVYGAVNPGRSGRRFPIDPQKYSKLAFKLAGAPGELAQVLWYHFPIDNPTNALAAGGRFVYPVTAAGFRIFVVDLAGGSEAANAPGQDWTVAPVLGLRLDPNSTVSSIGQQLRLDWVRLVPPDSSADSPTLLIQWTGPGGTYHLDVQELGSSPAEPLSIATGVAGTSYAWKYGILPPGPYRLMVTNDGSAQSATVDLSINAPPILHVTDPDETGGEDFATAVLENPWDMSDPADVAYTVNLVSFDFTGGQFNGTSPVGEVGRDSQVWLLKNDGNPSPLIDSSRYHRLTYRYTLDGPWDPGDGGSVARVFWGGQLNHADRLSTTEDIVVWSGVNTYTIDLATLRLGTDQGVEPSGSGELWIDAPKRFFRLDPHEGAAGRTFHIDDVRLAADDRVSPGGEFPIRWNWTDGDTGDSPTVTLYDDGDEDPSSGRTVIASGLPAADGQYLWTTPSTAGTHHIYAEITDGLNTTARYATGTLQVGNPEICGDCLDNDGNGLVDYEDPACCPQPEVLRLTRGRFLGGKGGLTRGHLALALAVDSSGFAHADPSADDATIQIHNANGELLCARLGHQQWKKSRGGFKFRSAGNSGGLQVSTFRGKKNVAQLKSSAPHVDVSNYGGELQLVFRLGGRCAQGQAMLRTRGKKGYVFP